MNNYIGFENLKKFYNKKVKVKDCRNKEYMGIFNLYIKPGDNEPEIESISLETPYKYYDINTPDISNIEVLN
ncbi:MAG: hypothetical protein PUG67_01965 [Peptoniphilaceae bacterium]|nr:hypothetical protein [Peptoniphilaceae bacterium]MDY6019194.1 hypothetical protein [Anaerococcus sp.]